MTKRVFISFAIEDETYRDLLVGQSRNDRCPFDFTDMSVKDAWQSEWKTKCRTKIKGCDGMIALLSRDTPNASGALWEVACAKEEGVPVLGVYVSATDKPAFLPTELKGVTVIAWSWAGIKAFIDGL